MQALKNRPVSQSQTFKTGQLSNAASPQKGYKTRVVYKNAPVEEDINDRRSLYGVSFTKSPQASQGQKIVLEKTASGQKITLADINTMKRSSTEKGNLKAAPKSRGSDRSDQKSQLSERAHLTRKETPEVLDVQAKGKVVEISRKRNPEMTETIYHPQERAQSVTSTKGGFHGCGCPVHDDTAIASSDAFKNTIKTVSTVNTNVNLNNNADYFDTVRRLDICGKCYGQQKKYAPKVAYKGSGLSIYKKDFVKHPLGEDGPVLKNDFYSTFHNSVPLDATTTMRNDFKPWAVGPVKKETMDWRPATSGIPFGGNTNYRIDYPNWGPNLIIPEKAPHQKTTIAELPFNARTTYNQEYCMPDSTNQLKPLDKDLWGAKKGSPFTSGIPFLGQTTHANTFKPFKVAKVPGFEPVQEYEPTQALPEHLKSLYNRDFGAPKQSPCPASVFMQHHPHPNYKYAGEKAV